MVDKSVDYDLSGKEIINKNDEVIGQVLCNFNYIVSKHNIGVAQLSYLKIGAKFIFRRRQRV